MVDPGVVARLGARIRHVVEAWSGILVQRPTLRAMIAGRLGPVERTFALAAVELEQVTGGAGPPQPAVGADVAAAQADALFRNGIELAELGLRIKPQESGTSAEHAGG